MSDSLIPSFLVSDVSESLRSLTKNERCERIAQVAHQKWATMSDSLRSLRGNERSWANRSGRSPKMSEWANRSFFWANRSFAHFFAKNERFAQKTDERIPSPAYYANSFLLSPPVCKFFHSATPIMQILSFCHPYYSIQTLSFCCPYYVFSTIYLFNKWYEKFNNAMKI